MNQEAKISELRSVFGDTTFAVVSGHQRGIGCGICKRYSKIAFNLVGDLLLALCLFEGIVFCNIVECLFTYTQLKYWLVSVQIF